MNQKQPIKLLSLFSGYGGAEFALQKAGIDFEVVGYSEIDKFAIQCYEQNHTNKRKLKLDEHLVLTDRIKEAHKNNFPIYKVSKIRNYGDATKIKAEELPDFDLLTGVFPCQSFSVAGKGAGVCDARGTLFWDIWRIAKEKQPKYMLLENVKGLTSKRHKETFDKILKDLDEIGYDVHWKVLNSKEHGIPQNRERVWFVCIHREKWEGYRNKSEYLLGRTRFKFPEKTELKIFLKDILEDEVDEKYYLTESNIKTINRNFGSKGKILDLTKDFSLKEKITFPSRIKQHDGLIVPTLTTAMGTGGGNVPVIMKKGERLRKLTPTECFRLMGFLDDGINLDGLSNTQRYKLAGNGWEINVVSKIFKNLL